MIETALDLTLRLLGYSFALGVLAPFMLLAAFFGYQIPNNLFKIGNKVYRLFKKEKEKLDG